MDIDHDGGPVVQYGRKISWSAGVLDRRCLQTAETSYSCKGYKNIRNCLLLIVCPHTCLFFSFSGPPPAMAATRLAHTGPSWADRVKCNHTIAKSSQPLAAPVDKLGKMPLIFTIHNVPFNALTPYLVPCRRQKRL